MSIKKHLKKILKLFRWLLYIFYFKTPETTLWKTDPLFDAFLLWITTCPINDLTRQFVIYHSIRFHSLKQKITEKNKCSGNKILNANIPSLHQAWFPFGMVLFSSFFSFPTKPSNSQPKTIMKIYCNLFSRSCIQLFLFTLRNNHAALAALFILAQKFPFPPKRGTATFPELPWWQKGRARWFSLLGSGEKITTTARK